MTAARVLVTGGSGFIGGWCVLAALTAGYEVRTTVRNLKKGDVLRAQLHAAREHGVRRVVLTSASGAIVYGHKPQAAPFTEENWSDVEADIPPYQKSKTLAERAAWEFIRTEGNGLELAAVHPTGVLGPILGNDDPPSLRTIRNMLAGTMPACPPFGTGWVDVRDVADLHLRAMTDPAAAGERFLATSGHSLRMVEVSKILRERLGDRAAKAPNREMPLFVARALSVINPQLRALRPQLGQNLDSTGAKAEAVLNWRPRPIGDSIEDTAESILAHTEGR